MLRNVAKRYGLKCLLHEKPFAGVNGSGKHLNYSIGNAELGTLFDPGATPHANAKFLVFCAAMRVGRYHSLVVRADEDAENPRFTVTARAPEGEVMALRYNDRPWVGVQFHPESVLTPDGLRLLGNFPQAVIGTGAESTDFSGILERLARAEDLSAEMAAAGFAALMDGKMTPAQAGAFLMPPLMEVEAAIRDIYPTEKFQAELKDLLFNYAGRETPLTYCPTLSRELGFDLWLKREDLLHTGAHKVNNTLGQALLAKYMGKTALVAETGAGQHGVATAAAAARLGMQCTVYMGAEDVERQAPNVMRMKLLGADVHAVESGTRTLKDAINEALRAWIACQKTTHYCFGTAAGPHPFPTLVRMWATIPASPWTAKRATLRSMARALPLWICPAPIR